ncbi:MAG TPA: aminopeptidase, partial [Candidatus Polarisedimenticolia bacterium]|nr:aminopeptidase [Candidatus Polarisedimenticolia bacterium]
MNFPDGEVFTGPIEDATEGVVCFTFPAVHGGRELDGVRVEFKGSRVTGASGGRRGGDATSASPPRPIAEVTSPVHTARVGAS